METIFASAESDDPAPRAFAGLVRRLGIERATVRERIRTVNGPRLGGIVEHRAEQELIARIDEPGPGVALLFAYPMGERVRTFVHLYLYEPRRPGRGGAVARLDGGGTLGRVSVEIPITTALELPGTVVRENLGIAFGLVVRSMGMTRNVTAGFRSLRKGEVPEYTELLEDARRHAIDRMVANAKLLGANAIVSMRFDSSEMGSSLTEVVAYGTAVVVEPA